MCQRERERERGGGEGGGGKEKEKRFPLLEFLKFTKWGQVCSDFYP